MPRRWTNFLRGHLGDRFPRTWLMIAATSNLSKFAVLDYASGQVRVGGGLQTGRINLVRAVPKGTPGAPPRRDRGLSPRVGCGLALLAVYRDPTRHRGYRGGEEHT